MNRDTCVKWLGLAAVYTDPEREILATLPIREQAYVHILKAFTEGEIAASTEVQHPVPTDVKVQGSGAESASDSRAMLDPEDIPFGDPAPTRRKRPTYALVWTWRKHRVVKTKARATRSMKAWKKWYERQGWKVSSHADGYFAGNSTGERHSIALHEYDRDTLERIR